jgi:hypothetical protein
MDLDQTIEMCLYSDTLEDCGDPNYVVCGGKCLSKNEYRGHVQNNLFLVTYEWAR